MTQRPKPLMRSVIKEELLALTNDYKLAIILNQMLYWSERVDDFDEFLKEEFETLQITGEQTSAVEYRNGWIYKKSNELSEETMLGLNSSNMLRHLSQLVDNGWLERRKNPKNKMDKTYQYRVNVTKIQRDLHAKGYALDSYPLLRDSSNLQNANTSLQNANTKFSPPESNLQNTNTNLQYENSTLRNEKTNLRNATAVPEITTEITFDDQNEDTSAREIQSSLPKSIIPNETTQPGIIPVWVEQCESAHIGQAIHQETAPTRVVELVKGNNDMFQGVDHRMSQRLGRMYIAKQGDYHAVKDLLASGVPSEFILDGIDYTFEHFANRRPKSFAYCAEIIKQLWAVEQEKHGCGNPVDFSVYSGRRHPSTSGRGDSGASSRSSPGQRDERYAAFYELFPDA